MKTQKLKNQDLLEELKEFMRAGVSRHDNIETWNDVREAAKEYFPDQTISMLDASGFITQFALTH